MVRTLALAGSFHLWQIRTFLAMLIQFESNYCESIRTMVATLGLVGSYYLWLIRTMLAQLVQVESIYCEFRVIFQQLTKAEYQ
jgi:hypothetical protein